jgi:hypothetical protein
LPAPGNGDRHAPPVTFASFMIQVLTGADDDFLPDGGVATIPPGDRRVFCRSSLSAPVNETMK